MMNNFYVNSEKLWSCTKSIFEDAPAQISVKNIDVTSQGRLKILVDDVNFDACFIKKNTSRLIVFVSGPGRKDYENPAFWRKSYSSYFEDSCLYVDDPCNIQKKYAPTYFWGDTQHNYADYLLEIVLKFKSIYNLSNDNITFMGCSNTGFVALYCASLLEGSLCLSFSPQFNIRLYLKDNNLFRKFNRLFKCNFEDSVFNERVEVSDRILNNKTSKYFISSNISCFFDKTQIDHFFKKCDLEYSLGLNVFDNKYVYISDFSLKNAHLFLPDESYCRFAYDFLRRGGLLAEDYYMFNALNKSLYWYFYERDRADRFWGSILYLKNIINNSVEKIQRQNYTINNLEDKASTLSEIIQDSDNRNKENQSSLTKCKDTLSEKDLIISKLNSELLTRYNEIDELISANLSLKNKIKALEENAAHGRIPALSGVLSRLSSLTGGRGLLSSLVMPVFSLYNSLKSKVFAHR